MYYFPNYFNVNKSNKHNLKSRNKAIIKEKDGICNPERYHFKLLSNLSLSNPKSMQNCFVDSFNIHSSFNREFNILCRLIPESEAAVFSFSATCSGVSTGQALQRVPHHSPLHPQDVLPQLREVNYNIPLSCHAHGSGAHFLGLNLCFERWSPSSSLF